MDEIAPPAHAFRYPIDVAEKDIDGMNHVNNAVYLTWMIRAAVAHSDAIGYSFQKFKETGGMFVVRRHEIDYLKPTLFGEKLTMVTWSEPMSGARATRNYNLTRNSDDVPVLRAKTFWVYVDLETGRPKPVPETISKAFTK